MCQYLRYQPPLRIWVLLTVLFLTSEEQDTVPVRWRRKSIKCSYTLQNCRYSCRVFPDSKIASRRSPRQWLHIMQKSQNIEQIVSSLAARVTALETNATSVSSGSGSARSWNILRRGDGSGSLGSRGPGSSDDNRNTRRKLDTFSSPVRKYHTGITNLINNLLEDSNMPACNKPVRIHCKAGSLSATKQEPSVRTLWPHIEMRVSPMKLIVRSATPKQLSRSANPSHLKTGKLENNFRLCGKFWPKCSKFPFSDGDDTGSFIVPALDARSQVLSIKDRRNGVGKPVFNLASFGSGRLFALIAPDQCIPGVLCEVLKQVVSQSSTANV